MAFCLDAVHKPADRREEADGQIFIFILFVNAIKDESNIVTGVKRVLRTLGDSKPEAPHGGSRL